MKIFITGVAGFLGSHLADKFIHLGHDVVGVDNLIGGFRCNLHRDVKFYQADCCDQVLMKDMMAHEEIDVVVHCAATAHEGFSVFSPSFITRNIYEASVSVISASIANDVKRFVFCSSMARYGKQTGTLNQFKEDMKPMPIDPYGIAKVAAEDTLKCLADVHGMEYNIAVPHNIIGERQKFDDPYRNVVSIMANRNLQDKPAIIYGDGEQKRCFSYVADCVSCLVKMALDKEIVNEVINIGPDEEAITIIEEKFSNTDPRLIEPLQGIARTRYIQRSNKKSEQAAERALALIVSNPATDTQDKVNAIIRVGDLYTLTADKRASDLYLRAWQLIQENEEFKGKKSQLFGRPERLWPRARTIVYLEKRPTTAEDSDKELFISAEYTVKSNGRVGNVKLLSKNVPNDEVRSLRTHLYETRFRPRIIDGMLVDTPNLVFKQRFVVSERRAPLDS